MWVYLGDESHPYIVYDYTPTRQGKGPALWLKNFKGYLQADAYSGYDALYDNADASEESEVPGAGVIEVACWAHARRKVYDARHSAPEQSHYALAMVRLLYDVENHIWITEEGDGNIKIGMTAVATALAGELVPEGDNRRGPHGVLFLRHGRRRACRRLELRAVPPRPNPHHVRGVVLGWVFQVAQDRHDQLNH